jgi:cytochrome c-type biogenesis protein CcmF
MLPLLLALPLGPCLAWKRGDVLAALQRLLAAGLLSLVAAALALALFYRGPWLAPFGVALAVWIVLGALTEFAGRIGFGRAPLKDVLARARGLPRSAFGTTLAHAGMGLTVLGIVATSAWQQEQILTMHSGERVTFAGYELQFRGTAPAQGPNYREQSALILVSRGGSPVTELAPSKRVYDAPPQPTTEAAIHVALSGDLYAVLGDEQADGSYVIRLYFNPLIRLIWLGAVVMFVGGALSLSDRRLRIGAPRRAAARIAAAE